MTPSYALGLFFILCVSLIWAAASVVVQHLYKDMNFDSPFLLTYISTSLFVLWLPTRLILERRGRIRRLVCGLWRRACKQIGLSPSGGAYEAMPSAADDTGDGIEGDATHAGNEETHEMITIIPWRNDDSIQINHVPNAPTGVSGHIEMNRQPYQSLSESSGVGAASTENENDSDSKPSEDAREKDKDGTAIIFGKSKSMENLDGNIKPAANGNSSATIHTQQQHQTLPVLSHVDHIIMAIKIAPVWFLSNYFYNTSLAYTSITSSTVLASTGSLFTFLFAVSCGDEHFTAYKLLGVILCFTGSVLTGLSDVEGDSLTLSIEELAAAENATRILDSLKPTASLSTEATRIILSQGEGEEGGSGEALGGLVLGDLAGLISAIGYGTYTVLIRSLCPENEDQYSMQLLLGYIGTFNGLVLLPIAIKLAFFDKCPDSSGTADASSGCEYISLVVLLYLVGKALADNVLSDYLWARAVVLTSATVATVGLGLTIPLAFLSDWVLGRQGVTSVESVIGALAVLAGFLFVNCGEWSDASSRQDNEDAERNSAVEAVVEQH